MSKIVTIIVWIAFAVGACILLGFVGYGIYMLAKLIVGLIW